MTARPAVAVRALERRFGRTGVLRGITLDIMPGEVFVIVGPNGSGKTTLLEVLATLLTPTGGRAEVFGHDVERAAAAARRSIGYAPSSLQSFYPRLSGLQNLLFFGTVYGTPADALRRRALALLDRLSLGAAAGERVERYSDGMKARLTIARALLTDAPLLLLDEPTKSLDPEGRTLARDMIAGDERGRRTIVWVTHDLAEAEGIATRVAALDAGVLRGHAGARS